MAAATAVATTASAVVVLVRCEMKDIVARMAIGAPNLAIRRDEAPTKPGCPETTALNLAPVAHPTATTTTQRTTPGTMHSIPGTPAAQAAAAAAATLPLFQLLVNNLHNPTQRDETDRPCNMRKHAQICRCRS